MKRVRRKPPYRGYRNKSRFLAAVRRVRRTWGPWAVTKLSRDTRRDILRNGFVGHIGPVLMSSPLEVP